MVQEWRCVLVHCASTDSERCFVNPLAKENDMEWSFIFTLGFSFLCSALLIAVLLAIVFEVLFIKDKEY